MNLFSYFGYLIITASVILPFIGVWTFIGSNKLSKPEDFAGLTMIALFIFVTMSTIGLIALASTKAIDLNTDFLKWLGGATVAEVAGICTIIVSSYFKKSS